MIKNSSIDHLKNTVGIVELMSNYITLKKSGSSYKAVCPFHNEKTASLMISPSKQIFKCFGCGVGGNIFSFLEKYENISFKESVEKIAKLYNFKLEYDRQYTQQDDYKCLELLHTFYRRQLDNHQTALKYLEQRHIQHNSIEKFELGFAPSSFEQLQFFNKNLIPLSEGIKNGVLGMGDQDRIYARITHRIVFPIYNYQGKLVGFGGRIIDNNKKTAKYLNSAETEFFKKSRLLYGYHLTETKKSIQSQQNLILTEGYLDVIMMHQAGFYNTVATLGTAMTAQHIPLLKKNQSKITLAYDGDAAGKVSAAKAAQLLLMNAFEGGVALMPKNTDPADLIVAKKEETLKAVLNRQQNFGNYVIDNMISEYKLHIPQQKLKAVKVVKDFLASLDPILSESYAPYATSLLKTPINIKGQQVLSIKNNIDSYDPSEVSIVKTLLLKPEFKIHVKNYLEASMFPKHWHLMQSVIENVHNDELLKIEHLDHIQILDSQALVRTLKILKIKLLEKKRHSIKVNQALEFNDKARSIKAINQEIIKLQ